MIIKGRGVRLKREGGLFSPPPPEKGEGLLETGSLFERRGGGLIEDLLYNTVLMQFFFSSIN